MKKTLTTIEAVNELMSDEYAGWSYAGATALIKYLEDLEDARGELIELDAIALRCEFREYADFADIAEAYAINIDVNGDGDNEIREYLNDKTTVIEFDGGIIIAEY